MSPYRNSIGKPSTLDRLLNLKVWREFNKDNEWVQTWSTIWIRKLERDFSLEEAGLKQKGRET